MSRFCSLSLGTALCRCPFFPSTAVHRRHSRPGSVFSRSVCLRRWMAPLVAPSLGPEPFFCHVPLPLPTAIRTTRLVAALGSAVASTPLVSSPPSPPPSGPSESPRRARWSHRLESLTWRRVAFVGRASAPLPRLQPSRSGPRAGSPTLCRRRLSCSVASHWHLRRLLRCCFIASPVPSFHFASTVVAEPWLATACIRSNDFR